MHEKRAKCLMRGLALILWLFINLLFFGMCGYMYLQWSQYWISIEKSKVHIQRSAPPADVVNAINQTVFDREINAYNRDTARSSLPLRSALAANKSLASDASHVITSSEHPSSITSVSAHPLPLGVYIKSVAGRNNNTSSSNAIFEMHKRPRFPTAHDRDALERNLMDQARFACQPNETSSSAACAAKTQHFKGILFTQLNAVMLDEDSVLFRTRQPNRYGVDYVGDTANYLALKPRELLCALRNTARMRTLTRDDVGDFYIADVFPEDDFFEEVEEEDWPAARYNSCAIVSSAGALLNNAKLGAEIDRHDLVMRFNDAPVGTFQAHVGARTTVRVLNSQVMSKDRYHLMKSPLYRGKDLTLLGWDASAYNLPSVGEWLARPEFNLFPKYARHRQQFKSSFYLLHPQSVWNVWRFLQKHMPYRLRSNPPSSGFLGLSALLPICGHVDMYEYVPSVRLSKQCHYYDQEVNSGCTFGVWHPLAAEKLLAYHMNSADDHTVFQRGTVRITGYRNLQC